MRYPQVLIYETDGLLARQLRRAEPAPAWSIREPRRVDACLRLLRRGGPAVLVIKLGRDLFRELTLLERAAWLYPACGRVVVCDSHDPVLEGLAWDLGADYVLVPPQSREHLLEIVSGLMRPPSAPAAGSASPSSASDDSR